LLVRYLSAPPVRGSMIMGVGHSRGARRRTILPRRAASHGSFDRAFAQDFAQMSNHAKADRHPRAA
jgi:hypothetical protein